MTNLLYVLVVPDLGLKQACAAADIKRDPGAAAARAVTVRPGSGRREGSNLGRAWEGFLSGLGAAADRSIRTPASGTAPLAAERLAELGGHAEEHPLPGIPCQHPIDELATRVDDLAGDAHERRNERAELHA